MSAGSLPTASCRIQLSKAATTAVPLEPKDSPQPTTPLLVVTRTYSKTWSMAAARLGYLIGPAWLVAELEKVVLPYHLDAVTQAAGTKAMVAVCGELAADERAARLLLALGVRELSVAPAAVPGVKQAVREALSRDTALVERCLSASGAPEVRRLLGC